MGGIRLAATDLWTVGLTCWGEARGEGSAGLYAVAWVIRNRHEHHTRWRGMSPRRICLAPFQFSSWLPSDPNLPKMQQVSCDDPVFVQCLVAAAEVFGGVVMSSVGRATHYYADTMTPPKWAVGSPVAVIGHHIFFENIA